MTMIENLSQPMLETIDAFAEDVHDIWRSTLAPGKDTPFEPNVIEIEVDGRIQNLDIANTSPNQLPASIRATSERTALFTLNMLKGFVELGPRELTDDRVHKMAIMLFTVWNFVKAPSDVSQRDLLGRQNSFQISDERVRVLDRRLIMAGVSTILDEQRYPLWQQLDFMSARAIPGVRHYGENGRQILEAVRQGLVVPLHDAFDRVVG